MLVTNAFDKYRPFTYHTPTNVRWADAAHTQMLMDVVFNHLQGEVPFRADPNDIEEHGRELYAHAAAGDFGPVGDYEAPPPPARWAVPTNIIVKRVLAAGRLAEANALLDANQEIKWRFQTAGAVWSDDPPMLAALAALGLDSKVIMARL